jgi:homogentisate 1,2-dioxygenase
VRKWINFPRQEGISSRQAHADLPETGIYEREIGRNGFFGPATHLHHKHAPTSWTDWTGPLRPRAFNLNGLAVLDYQVDNESPWSAPVILSNAHCRFRLWHCHQDMKKLVRNADGDDLLFIHEGSADLFCDYGHLQIVKGDYVVIPRSTLWRLEPKSPMQIVMIEATNDSYQLPERGIVGPHAVFDPAMLDTPKINDDFVAQQD